MSGLLCPAGVHFIPAHPIAGTEYSGPEAGFASLFDNRWAILTPVPGSDAAAVERLKSFWQGLGSQVDVMDAAHHDRVLAITSHIPHLIAYTIVGTADDLEAVTEGEVIKYSAGGFRDFTRIAASRSHHVARRVPEQSRCGAGSAWALQRRPRACCSAPCATATARPCSTYSPAPAPSAAPLSISARIPPRPISDGTRARARVRQDAVMNLSLDGYVDHRVAAKYCLLFVTQVARRVASRSVYGRRIYQVMQYWDEDRPEWDADEHLARWRIAEAAEMGCVARTDGGRSQRHLDRRRCRGGDTPAEGRR